MNAMKTMGFGFDQAEVLWKILSAVLNLVIKWKKPSTLVIILKSDRIIIERYKIDTSNTDIHDQNLVIK